METIERAKLKLECLIVAARVKSAPNQSTDEEKKSVLELATEYEKFIFSV